MVVQVTFSVVTADFLCSESEGGVGEGALPSTVTIASAAKLL